MAKRLRILLLACMLVIGMSSVPVGPSNASPADSGSSSSATSTLSKQSKKCKKLKKKAKKSKKAMKKYKKKCKKKSGSGGGGGGTGGGSGTCPAYVPGEVGAGAETTIVTDAATEAAPVEVAVPTDPAAGGAPPDSSAFRNIQVNSAAATTGLWVRFEMEVGEDYDIYLFNADGTEAAAAGGYNPAPVVPGETDGTGSGGHSEQTAEQLDGVATPDCGGYTLEMSSFQTPGGDKTLKVWLGPSNCTPPCGGPAKAHQ